MSTKRGGGGGVALLGGGGGLLDGLGGGGVLDLGGGGDLIGGYPGHAAALSTICDVYFLIQGINTETSMKTLATEVPHLNVVPSCTEYATTPDMIPFALYNGPPLSPWQGPDATPLDHVP